MREFANELFDPIPITPPDLPNNIISRQRVDLGAMLFFDPRMSRSGLFSCQSCHNVGLGGGDGLETSIGHGWQAGPRNSPTVYNAVFNIAQFWDGRAQDLMEQAMGPVVAGVEMNNTPERLLETLNSMEEYVTAFEEAFPGEEDPVTFENFARAIESFEATLITPNSRFDQYLKGIDALTEQEVRGLESFIDQGCASCHAGINMGGEAYYPFGLVERPGANVLPEGDRGRFQVTATAADDYVFPRLAAPQHRADRALFPLRRGLVAGRGRRGDGRLAAGRGPLRAGNRRHRRLPTHADRRDPRGRAPDAAGLDGRDPAPRADVIHAAGRPMAGPHHPHEKKGPLHRAALSV